MSVWNDLKVLYHLTLSPIRGDTHAARLESFYGKQAGAYDDFRAHLLRGREELFASLPGTPGGIWVDMGAGTGANLDFFSNRVSQFSKVYLVDLSAGLLDVARRRAAARGWSHVTAVECDVIDFAPPEGLVDLVTFSYSLTMIPDWFAAIDRALRLLKPGGTIGIVDFYVSRKYPDRGDARHGWWTRTFWPTWFGFDNVHPSRDHVPYLRRRFRETFFSEHRTRLKYLPLGRVPYYRFVGIKIAETLETGTGAGMPAEGETSRRASLPIESIASIESVGSIVQPPVAMTQPCEISAAPGLAERDGVDLFAPPHAEAEP